MHARENRHEARERWQCTRAQTAQLRLNASLAEDGRRVAGAELVARTSGTLVDLLDRLDAGREVIGGLRAIFPPAVAAGARWSQR